MQSEKPIKITLYHAKWCGHCTKFKPTWNEMKENKDASAIIKFIDHEEDTFDDLSEKELSVAGTNVRELGYPTIKININDHEYMYSGNRTINDIYSSIINEIKKINSITESDNNIDILMSASSVMSGNDKKSAKKRYAKWN